MERTIVCVSGICSEATNCIEVALEVERPTTHHFPLCNQLSRILIPQIPAKRCAQFLGVTSIAATKQLKQAGDIIQVPLLDHVIIGDDFTSLKEEGFI